MNTLVIGATSAIAAEVARRCAWRGDRVYLIARNEARLEALARELGESVIGTEAADLNDCEGNDARIERAHAALGCFDWVLVAHGLLGDQLESEASFAEAERILDTNLVGIVSLLVPIANILEAQAKGALAVMSSVAAERGRPRNFTYGAAKAGLNVYLQGQRSRLFGAGVRVHILKLGPVDTPMTKDHTKNPSFSTPGYVADRILEACKHRKSEVYIPGYWRFVMWVVRRLPEPIFQRLGFLSSR